MRTMDCRVAWKHSYLLTALLYYINESKLDDLSAEQIATVEYVYQQIGTALGLGREDLGESR